MDRILPTAYIHTQKFRGSSVYDTLPYDCYEKHILSSVTQTGDDFLRDRGEDGIEGSS